ncbi:MAG: diacylglycerol kinase [Pseudomonadota bacterium]
MKNRSFLARLGFAWSGVASAWRSERSFRTQVILTALLLPFMLWLQPELFWWAIVGVMVGLVLAAELFNTALEHLIDHLHPEIHPTIKIAKDCAAAAVLILSIVALIVAGLMVWSELG